MRSTRRELLEISLGMVITSSVHGQTETSSQVQLPKPQTDGGKPLMQALTERRSTRSFADKPLPEQVLSNLLWAAWGINRSDGKRTAPSAMNRQEIDVYVILARGAFLYQAKEHTLQQVAAEDLRGQAGTQDFVKDAPLNLVYVADTARMGGGSEESKILYYGAATGFISQNVYLFCASEGLATVVRASLDRDSMRTSLRLRPEQRITLAQTVGYPR